ncbi:acetate kinase (plasmid) [Sphingomonas sp. HMP9]|uniref:acetate/propionate family kinase n=1 Tax=Sphingomonas sp. HMP9 TaxID=1517554 RepID=UPI00159763C8|nr:acetate kinase [Sphingomonas sp. HMP9]BCA64366.1 acetate kinase [Sphingomonas sp. HMP9]
MAPMSARGGTGGNDILTLNEGSSSLKFGFYEAGPDGVEERMAGDVEGAQPADMFDRIDAALDGARPAAIGHRIVHGGSDLFDPVKIDASVLMQLERATTFAPLHGPAALSLIRAAQARYPNVPQIACFDTGFHADLPQVAAVLPIPKAFRADGVRRYGFHGLSCQSIVSQLGSDLPERLIIAHLGSGASITAVRDAKSVDTSMGLTPSGGIVMASRAGDLDPGLLLYLMRERGMDAADIEDIVDRRSGLLGISGLSRDVRKLHAVAATDADAALAIEIFCRSVAKQIAAMMASLGGADMIVFTGGIGENDAVVRSTICNDLGWAGVQMLPAATGRPRVIVRTLPSQEGAEIARAVWRLTSTASCAR